MQRKYVNGKYLCIFNLLLKTMILEAVKIPIKNCNVFCKNKYEYLSYKSTISDYFTISNIVKKY